MIPVTRKVVRVFVRFRALHPPPYQCQKAYLPSSTQLADTLTVFRLPAVMNVANRGTSEVVVDG
jgi:hypothetical protein